nr:hypothetical protein Iba_chr04aCG12770 [Ipomoea batatas]GMC82192.1 hypothetical protein Iba_chr04bCG11100 [Ipomoea batatas]GMC89026.1 hypothetical protein Iba_chr04eCG15610 [Ipomoea batatas]GMD13260.1 hypothetical protein Iba_scaffold40568CG0010 [Ipomoea batatas]GME01510.1 hypothetical protein Iba_scaffold1678028CG0010 [Ipomoea batatas]
MRDMIEQRDLLAPSLLVKGQKLFWMKFRAFLFLHGASASNILENIFNLLCLGWKKKVILLLLKLFFETSYLSIWITIMISLIC